MPRWKGGQRRIGLTGGIATGKSSVGHFLSEVYSFPSLDADLFAHKALAPGTSCTNKVIDRYGKEVVDSAAPFQEVINRKALAKIIFADSQERLWLESLIHPFVVECLEDQLRKNQDRPVVILTIPLLFETRLTYLCSEVWLVTCTPYQQLKRLINRDHLTEREATWRLNSQWSIEEKEKLSDFIIDNSGPPNSWKNRVKSLI